MLLLLGIPPKLISIIVSGSDVIPRLLAHPGVEGTGSQTA